MTKVVFIFLLIINSLFAQEKKNIVLQLNWLNQFQFAGYYVAKEKGFYKNVGLNVTINELKTKKELVNLVKEGKADFAVGRSSLLLNKINGDDIIAIAAIYQSSPLMLLTTDIENIKSIDDFKNKKIMITPDAEYTASITAMLHANNIKYNDLEVLTHSFNIDDLINKKTDLMASYISNEPVKLEQKGIRYNIFHPKNFGFDFYSDILFTSSKFIKENPTTTLDFYKATIKGWEYAFKNKIQTAQLIFDKYNTQNKTLLSLKKEADLLEKLAIDKNDKEIGTLDEKKLQSILDTFKVLGLTKSDLDFDDFIYEENNHKTLIFELSKEQQILVLMFIMFTLTIFLVILYSTKQIYNKRELLSSVLNSSDDLIFYKDKKLRYIGCNKVFEKFVELPKEVLMGKDDFEVFDKETANLFRTHDLNVLDKNKLLVNDEWLNIDGKLRLFQTKKMPFKYSSSSGIGILGVSRDITDLYEIQKKLEEQATIDDLTKTYNRKLFNERLVEKIEMYRRYDSIFCIAMLDIDDFKNINDTYGHDVGDKVLINICNIIKKHIRNTDMLFRVGGEEFVIIYPKNVLKEAYISTEHIRKMIEQSRILDNIKTTVSIGVTEVIENDDEDTIFKRADDLMYYSKNNGKNRTSRSIN